MVSESETGALYSLGMQTNTKSKRLPKKKSFTHEAHAKESAKTMKTTPGTKTIKAHTSKKHTEAETNESTKPLSTHEIQNLTSTSTVSNESENAIMKTTLHPSIGNATLLAPASDTTSTSAAAPPTALPYVKAPPALVLPPLPKGVVTTPSAQVRAQLPKKEELELMPDAESELARFENYVGVFGKTAPSQAAMQQTLGSAYQWSLLRIELQAWASYAQSQEAMAWFNARGVIQRMAPALTLAVTTDSAIGETSPSLGRLFGVRSSIAKRSAAVRVANAKLEAAGQAPYKGKSGKRRKKVDGEAALAAKQAAATPTPPVVVASPVVTPAPVADSSAPVVSSATVAPAVPAVNVGAVAHS